MTFRISSLAALAMTMLLVVSAGCSMGDSPTSPPGGDVTAPTVSSTNPINGATGVAAITATFSEPMAASSITATSFTVSGPGLANVAGFVSYNPSNWTASFAPSLGLVDGTRYTATITIGATDAAGNAMVTSKVWTFTTVLPSVPQPPPVAPRPPVTW